MPHQQTFNNVCVSVWSVPGALCRARGRVGCINFWVVKRHDVPVTAAPVTASGKSRYIVVLQQAQKYSSKCPHISAVAPPARAPRQAFVDHRHPPSFQMNCWVLLTARF